MTRTYIRDYGKQIELVKTNFPEIYDLYRRGSVIIDDVYTYEKDGKERVGIHYLRAGVPDPTETVPYSTL